MEIKCVQCGSIFELSEGEKQYFERKGLSFPKRCKSCRESNKRDNYQIICERCGKPFPFPKGERQFYIKNMLRAPKYCKDCRLIGNTGPSMKKNSYQSSVELYGPRINVNGGLTNSPGFKVEKIESETIEYSTDYLGKKRRYTHTVNEKK